MYVVAFTRWLVPLPPWNQSLLVRYFIRQACVTCRAIAALTSRTKPADVQERMVGLCLFRCLEGGTQQAARARTVACKSSTLTCRHTMLVKQGPLRKREHITFKRQVPTEQE